MMIPVSVNKHTPFRRAFALQSSSINCSPAPDVGVVQANLPYFPQTPVCTERVKTRQQPGPGREAARPLLSNTTYTYIYIYIYIYIYDDVVCIHSYMYVHIYIYIHIYAYLAYLSISLSLYIYIYIYIYDFALASLSLSLSIYILMYIYIYIHMYCLTHGSSTDANHAANLI